MKKQEENQVYDSLLGKLSQLKKEMEDIRDKLKMARLDGDLSENADWKILNEKLENLQQQDFLLREKLFILKDRVESEILITFQLLETGEEKVVKLTEEWDADPTQGRISVTSPLGLALAKKQVGEIAEVQTPERVYKIQIINIK